MNKVIGFLIKNQTLILLILLGLLIRLLFCLLPGFKIDVDAWFAWSQRIYQLGPTQFYSQAIWTNYTPGFLYLLYPFYLLKTIFSIPNPLFYSLLKLPSIISEIILSLVVFNFVKKSSLKYAYLGMLLILFNPAVIFNSSIWGQIDGLLTLFILSSVLLLHSNKLIHSSFLFGVSFLIKPQTIAIAPVYILYILKHLSLKTILYFLMPFILIVFLLSLPFFINNPLIGFINLVTQMTNDYHFTSLYAYNFWGMVGFWINDQQTFLSFTYHQLGIALFLTYWIIISSLYLTGKLSLISLATLSCFAFFFLPTRVHERYLYPAIVLLILNASLLKSKWLLYYSLLISILHLLNLYYVYVYYNEHYLNLPKLLYQPNLYKFLDANGFILSLVSTLLFTIITIHLIYISYAKSLKTHRL